MAWAWIENGNIFVSDSEYLVPKDIAIEVPDGTLPQDLTIENGNIVFKTEAQRLAESKADLIKLLQNRATAYITTYYPDSKQRSDVSDKEIGETYLVYKQINITQLRADIASQVLTHYPDFNTALNNILTIYGSTQDPYINYWLTQLMKVAFRQYFVHRVKQQYYQMKQNIEDATSKNDLPAPDSLTFNEPWPEGV
jgi:hypothetical protein